MSSVKKLWKERIEESYVKQLTHNIDQLVEGLREKNEIRHANSPNCKRENRLNKPDINVQIDKPGYEISIKFDGSKLFDNAKSAIYKYLIAEGFTFRGANPGKALTQADKSHYTISFSDAEIFLRGKGYDSEYSFKGAKGEGR